MLMSTIQHVIRQCTNTVCAFRFPVTVAGAVSIPGEVCPQCGAMTEISLRWQLFPESLSRDFKGYSPFRRVLLDNLRSAWNVGSIVRTADGLGFSEVFVCGITPQLTHPGVAKTGLGAEKNIAWQYHTNALTAIDQLMADGWRLWALEEHPEALTLGRADKMPPDQKTVLVVGNELSGIDPAVLERCERIYAIPMLGLKRSINAAVAFGIAAYLLTAE